MAPVIWMRLVKYLGPFDADPWTEHPGQVRNLHNLPVSIALASGAANLLTEWPMNFDRLLFRIRSAAPSATHIADAFGSLYRVLYRDLNEPALAFLRNRFEAHLHENWFGLLGRRNRRLQSETVAAHPHRPTKDIARAAKTGAAAVRHLASAGVIRARAIEHPSGRITWVIPQAEACNVEACRIDSLPLSRAARLLGLERTRVRELIDAGLLRAWINPTLMGAATWWLSKADALHLTDVAQRASQIRDSHDSCVAFATVLKTWRLREGEFPALVRALVAGELCTASRIYGRQGLGSMVFEANALRAWLDSHRAHEQSWMSVATAASWLGLKQQVAYELVARGLLVAEIQDGTRRVHRDAAQAFRSSYVSLAEIAAICKRTPRYMLARIAGKPVCGPMVDGARQYFYKRDEIGTLLAG
jgi:hypothetical protein